VLVKLYIFGAEVGKTSVLKSRVRRKEGGEKKKLLGTSWTERNWGKNRPAYSGNDQMWEQSLVGLSKGRRKDSRRELGKRVFCTPEGGGGETRKKKSLRVTKKTRGQPFQNEEGRRRGRGEEKE